MERHEQGKLKKLLEDYKTNKFSTELDELRLFVKIIPESIPHAVLLMRLVNLALFRGVKPVKDFKTHTNMYLIQEETWWYLCDQSPSTTSRRRLNTLQDKYAFITTRVTKINNVKKTLVGFNWFNIWKQAYAAHEFLVNKRKVYEESTRCDLHYKWVPRPLKLLHLQPLLTGEFELALRNRKELLFEKLKLFYTTSKSMHDVFYNDGFFKAPEVEEIDVLDLSGAVWNLKDRVNSVFKVYEKVCGASFFRASQKDLNIFTNLFRNSDLDFGQATFVGVALSTLYLSVDNIPKNLRAAMLCARSLYSEIITEIKAQKRFDPCVNFVIDEVIRSGWIEAQLFGKQRAPKSLLETLLSKYPGTEPIQNVGLILRLFPYAYEEVNEVIRKYNLITKLEDLEHTGLKDLYDCLYPGVLHRIKHVNEK